MLRRWTRCFSRTTLHSPFSHVELFRKLISNSNNNYHHPAFVETEVTTDPVSKKTWSVCPANQHRTNEGKNLELKDEVMKTRQRGNLFFLLVQSSICRLFGLRTFTNTGRDFAFALLSISKSQRSGNFD